MLIPPIAIVWGRLITNVTIIGFLIGLLHLFCRGTHDILYERWFVVGLQISCLSYMMPIWYQVCVRYRIDMGFEQNDVCELFTMDFDDGCVIPVPGQPWWSYWPSDPCHPCHHLCHQATHTTSVVRSNSLAVCLLPALFRFILDFACWRVSFSQIVFFFKCSHVLVRFGWQSL